MLEPNDIELIVDTVKQVVDRLLADRLEQVYAVLEETREQMQHTVLTLEGNDQALLGEIRKVQHATPAEVLTMAGESWASFVTAEAERIGLRVIDPTAIVKKKKATDEMGD